jgi:hypothetical protein
MDATHTRFPELTIQLHATKTQQLPSLCFCCFCCCSIRIVNDTSVPNKFLWFNHVDAATTSVDIAITPGSSQSIDGVFEVGTFLLSFALHVCLSSPRTPPPSLSVQLFVLPSFAQWTSCCCLGFLCVCLWCFPFPLRTIMTGCGTSPLLSAGYIC